ncbi:peptidyl-prolyl cis-trans isomerase [Burkholderia sp. AU39826]|uniref:peptidylprolyl isomerase n=1 Tax=Burkholderia sp. AU39826 TaxID=2879634 RepID=UPI001CF56AF5|nr:peptidyl-prolyl cis-trans isomerase [Burkholderia sp. AU39826]MCA7970308.1 peptidyl-prolyl cis-trans isomerase [Burkholderia sp. AU39826]
MRSNQTCLIQASFMRQLAKRANRADRMCDTNVRRCRTRLIVSSSAPADNVPVERLHGDSFDTSYPKPGFVGRAARSPGSVFFSARGRSRRCPRRPHSRTDTRECLAATGGLGRICTIWVAGWENAASCERRAFISVFPFVDRRGVAGDGDAAKSRATGRTGSRVRSGRGAIARARPVGRRRDRLPAVKLPHPPGRHRAACPSIDEGIVMKKHRISIVSTLIALACACGAPVARAAGTKTETPLPPGVEAVVNDTPIARSDVDGMIEATGQAVTPELRAQAKHELIARHLVEQAAEKANYGSRPEVNRVVMRARTVAAADLYLRDNVHPQAVTDAQVKARYDDIVANAAQFEYRADVIAVADPVKVNALVAELKQGAAFDAVAKKYNTTPNGGVAQWVELRTPLAEGKTGGLPLPLAQAITSLQPGAVAGPIRVGNAFAIVKLDEKRPTVVPTFDAAKNVLRQQLEAQARQRAMTALVDKLAEQATIQQ